MIGGITLTPTTQNSNVELCQIGGGEKTEEREIKKLHLTSNISMYPDV